MNKNLNIKVNLTGAERASQAMKSFGGNVKNSIASLTSMTNLVRGAFASALVLGTVNLVKTAAAANDVEKAFKRISTPTLLAELQKATKNTVNDFNLMKAAVRANNFQIPLKDLGSLLEFAQRRAKETGESVDYLVNSIVMGIGRKSPLILDNLGISAVRLRKELKGAGTEMQTVGDIAAAVGKIATEEMKKMGKAGVSNSDRIEQFSAAVDNLKIVIGNIVQSPAAREFERWTVSLQMGFKGLALYAASAAERLVYGSGGGLAEQQIQYFKLMQDFYQRLAAEKPKFTPDMLFTEAGRAAEAARQRIIEAEKNYFEWVMGIEDEAQKRKQVAEWQARYNKELAISMGYWNTNPQATADPLMGLSRQGGAMDADPISQSALQRSQKRVAQIEDDLRQSTEKYQQEWEYASNMIANELSWAIASAMEDGKISVNDFVEYFKNKIIQQIIYLAIKTVISKVADAYTGGGGSTAVNAVTSATGLDSSYGGSVGGGGIDYAPTIGGIGGSVGGGNNINVVVQGNVMSRGFVMDSVIPEIKRATRLGR